MKKGYTHIAILLDRSGSMSSIKEEMITGFNDLIKSQKEVPGDVTFSVSQFDNEYDILYDFAKIDEIKELTSEVYIPRGMTALNDSLSTLIDAVGKKLANLPESERPEKVLFHIITDGYENGSEDRDGNIVRTKIKHQEDNYQWCFNYIGANQDAMHEARGKNINNALNFKATKFGAKAMFDSLSMSTAMYRSANTDDKVSYINTTVAEEK